MKQKRLFSMITIYFLLCMCVVPVTKSNAATPYKLSGKFWTKGSSSQKGSFKNGAILFQAKNNKELRKICIQFENNTEYKGSLMYKVKTSDKKWSSYAKHNTILGNKDSYIERIQIKLTGDMAKNYHIFYRTKLKGEGWLGWSFDGRSAGSTGAGNRITGLQIILVKKWPACSLEKWNGIKSDEQHACICYKKTPSSSSQHQHEWKPVFLKSGHTFCNVCNMDLTAAGISSTDHSLSSGTYTINVGGELFEFYNCAGCHGSHISHYKCRCGAIKDEENNYSRIWDRSIYKI